MRIQVTQDDIDRGHVGSECFCPIALAARRALGENIGLEDVSVGSYTVRVRGTVYYLPTAAIRFVKSFDRRVEVRPFEFEVTE